MIALWQEAAARQFPAGQEFSDRKLARFLAGMYQDVRAAQMAEATREATAQAEAAAAGGHEQQADRWRRAAANLDAMRQSVGGSGFVPVPHPRQG